MGRGDKRTKKGKIWRGSFGKWRPKQKNLPKNKVQGAKTEAKEAETES